MGASKNESAERGVCRRGVCRKVEKKRRGRVRMGVGTHCPAGRTWEEVPLAAILEEEKEAEGGGGEG